VRWIKSIRAIALLGVLVIVMIAIPVLAQDRGDLIAWWPLDEPYGVRDDAYGDHALTDNNSVLSASGVQGSAAVFNPDNSEYLSYHGTLATGNFTAVAWVKRQHQGESCAIISDGWSVDSIDGALRVMGSDVVTHTSSIPLGGWVFVGVSYEHPTVTLSLNAQTVTGTMTMTHGSDFEIGAGCPAYIDEVAVWDRALSEAEISGIYNSGVGLSYDDLPEADAYTAYMPYVARNAVPSDDPWPGWGDDDDDDPIVIDYENERSWWEWARAIGDAAIPVIGWLSEARVQIDDLMSDAYLMEFDISEIDRYDMSTLADMAGEDPLDISSPSLAQQAANMGHAMGQPFAWLREANRYMRSIGGWWFIALINWLIGAMSFVVFIYTVTYTIKLAIWLVDLAIAIWNLIPVIG
jgi:hypothetical protein